MMIIKPEEIFVLSSTTRVTKGFKRSILVDYLRNEIQIISNQYYDLIQLLNRNKISHVIEKIEPSSQNSFNDFIDFMLEKEFAFLTTDLNLFPEISTNLHDEHVILRDCILEIDIHSFNDKKFKSIIIQLDEMSCDDIQLNFISEVKLKNIKEALTIVEATDINCVELHFANAHNISQSVWFSLIERYTSVSKIFVYNTSKSKKVDYTIHRKGNAPLTMGYVYYIETALDAANCGVISQHNLSFGDIAMNNLLKHHNGCLYKKLTIDRKGRIKNCPYMEHDFGEGHKKSIKEVVTSNEFKELWSIKKDDIQVCKDCEFRYNCTDCRAFLSNKSDILSKPLKCGYNPYTNIWEDWSKNALKGL